MTENKLTEQTILHAVLRKSIITGLCGGIIWSVVWMILFGFNMVRISPVLFWDKMMLEKFSFDKWYMYLIAIILYSVLSILIALIYYALFKKIKHWLMGAVYGIIVWAIFLFGFPFIYSRTLLFINYPTETSVGLLCLCILYGLFIGYSISFDYERLQIEAEKSE